MGSLGAAPSSLGQLPALPKPPAREMAGPTPYSNWVITGQVLAGAYPASLDDLDTERMLTLLLELGVNTFVCLQAEVNIHVPDHVWRAGGALRPYIRDAQRVLSRAHETNSSRIPQRKIDFLHLPIIDGSVTTDMAMSRLADDCCERVLRGEKLYIHCWGGHGRTGTLVATMLGRLYGLPFSTALRHTQAYHDSRDFPQGVRSPQTAVQRAQVRRLLLLPSPIAAAALRAAAAGSSPTRNIGLTSSSSSSSVSRDTSSSSAGSVLTPATPAKQQLAGAAAAAGTGAWPCALARAPAPAVTAGSSFLNCRASSSNKFTESNLAGSSAASQSLLQPSPAKSAAVRAATSGTPVLYGSCLQQQRQAHVGGSTPATNVYWNPVPRTPVHDSLSSKSSLLRRSLAREA